MYTVYVYMCMYTSVYVYVYREIPRNWTGYSLISDIKKLYWKKLNGIGKSKNLQIYFFVCAWYLAIFYFRGVYCEL